ncbi:hypothetical protein LUZ63_011557 [Rhynchospora breviuscula]|uniref:HMA domain-containing protein n=1 Tax=Rhynchospora breviuscula TaxID=2022672 RepID=A0A9Q0HQN1_9POAL|nr:hypothetical protein LUZ63_011557 [Rhynchospora breviuscula]
MGEEGKTGGEKQDKKEKQQDKKEKKQGEEEKNETGEEKKGGEEKKTEEKKEEGDNGGKEEVIMKVHLHCEGCAMKVKKAIRAVPGAERVKLDFENNKITVSGKADPWKLKQCIELKTKKNVEIISPVDPPKKKDDSEKKPATTDDNSIDQKKKGNSKKPREVPESTVVLKIRLHCEGCIDRIRRIICKIKGVKEVTVDENKDLVTVRGTMDVKSLPNILAEKLKRSVEVVPVKKEDTGDTASTGKKEKGSEKTEKVEETGDKKEKKEMQGKGSGEAGGKKGKNKKKEKEANNNEKKDKEEKKEEKNNDEEEEKKAEDKPSAELADLVKVLPPTDPEMINRFDFFQPYGYRGPEFVHAPQIFSDENPNACAVM